MEENRTVAPEETEAPVGPGRDPAEEAAVDPGLPTAEMLDPGAGEPAQEPEASRTAAPDQSEGLEGSAQPQEPVVDPGLPTPGQFEELLFPRDAETPAVHADAELKAVIEAIIYVTEEPLSRQQIAAALEQPLEKVEQMLAELSAEFEKAEHGIAIREVAGGYKMATKPEHHDAVRNFVKSLKPPLKLSLAALETLAVIAYKQPVTAPEITEIRGVQGTGVLKTLLDRKLIAAAGRKNVIGKPILYKTTKDFLVQFGLKDLSELPSLKEFEEIRRMALSDEPDSGMEAAAAAPQAGIPEPPPAGDLPPAEPPVEPPPGEEEPAVEPPPGEEGPPQRADQD